MTFELKERTKEAREAYMQGWYAGKRAEAEYQARVREETTSGDTETITKKLCEKLTRIEELEDALRRMVIDGDNSDFPGDHPFHKSLKHAVVVLGDDPR